MIQRLQSILLFSASATMVIVFLIPLLKIEVGFEDALGKVIDTVYAYKINIMADASSKSTWGVGVIGLLSIFFPFISIFFYKNRVIQKRFIIYSLAFVLLLYIAVFVNITSNYAEINSVTHVMFGTFLPILAIILEIWAYKCVSNDQKKVESSNRIR